jgi:hypothetical protein
MSIKDIWEKLRQFSYDELKEHAKEAVKDVVEGLGDDEHDFIEPDGPCRKCGVPAGSEGKCTFQGFYNPPPPMRKP